MSEKEIEFLKSKEAEELYFRGNPKLKNIFVNILAEREQKDNRIQELEEENYIQKIQIYENSIPKQVVIAKIEQLKNDYDKKYDVFMGYKVESREQQDILKQIGILQELLKEDK